MKYPDLTSLLYSVHGDPVDPVVLGVIGGSGLYQIDDLIDVQEVEIETPFGSPSDRLIIGQLMGLRVAFLPRHGRGHRLTPSEINYQANIWALKRLGVRFVLSVSAVGSLQAHIEPGHLICPDQFIDRTYKRANTFFGDGIVGHVSFGDPVDPHLRAQLFKVAQAASSSQVHDGGSYVCIEGPTFSTRAESLLFQAAGASIVGMTNLPEARLAREAELAYATLALSTDFDCWHADHDDVSVESVIAVMKANIAQAKDVIKAFAAHMLKAKDETYPSHTALGYGASIMTAPSFIPARTRERVELLFGSYLTRDDSSDYRSSTLSSQPILIVGSVAFDDVETPAGRRPQSLGGSANYFAVGASHFAPVQLVAVVGEDFPNDHISSLQKRGVDVEGLEVVSGQTFFWRGSYGADFGDAKTLDTQLNVFADFQPKIPENYRNTPYLFLGNIHPSLQEEVVDQVSSPKLIGCDTMNFWITGEPEALTKLLRKIDLLVINEGEARLLSGEKVIPKAVEKIRGLGPQIIVIKKGGNGAALYHPEGQFHVPAFPLKNLVDPTGAGDSFASGLMGYIASQDKIDLKTMKTALLYGTVLASFACEAFSFDRTAELTSEEIATRFNELKAMISID